MNNEAVRGEDMLSRKMPCSLSAERALLGSILIDPNSINEIAATIGADDFYVQEHKQIYLAMRELFDASQEIDPVTLIDTLVHKGVYEKSGGESYIRSLLDVTPSAMNIADYARIVKEESTRRRIIDVCSEISDLTYGEQEGVAQVLDLAQSRFTEIAQGRDSRTFRHIRDVLRDLMENLHKLQTDKAAAMGTPTGFSGVDKLLVGMGDSDLVLVGARPGMGKTAFALNVATNVAFSSGKKVCLFSLEMSAEQLASRMIASEALVDSYSLRSGQIQPEDWKKIADAAMRLSNTDLLIDDTSGITVTAMKAKLRRVENLGLVVVDYLGLMESEQHYDNRALEVSVISRGLKLMAKELRVPILCCAQLSRGPEGRTDKRPQLSDLRDSGAIEQDADVVMFLYRDEYYNTSRDPDQKEGNIAEVIIQKNRHGSTGNVKMAWLGTYTKFRTIDTDREEP
ncbi:MAG: replicative DNA helicase [Clostridia bacterium]|nr:replicative DNA helicase [Clostridia bacterium]MBR3863142.1 replicative DNA helicase [Clostridia bacterium]